MADGKAEDALEVDVTALEVEPEESADVSAPVTVTVTATPSRPTLGGLWVLQLEVDDATEGGQAVRHCVQLAAAPEVGAGSVTLTSGVWPDAGTAMAADGATAVLRLSLFELGSDGAVGGAGGGKEGDGPSLGELPALLKGREAALDVNCMVSLEAAPGGGLQRCIMAPL